MFHGKHFIDYSLKQLLMFHGKQFLTFFTGIFKNVSHLCETLGTNLRINR